MTNDSAPSPNDPAPKLRRSPSDTTTSVAPRQLNHIEVAAAVHNALAEAQVLLAETRIRCHNLLDDARTEATQILDDARSNGQRIIADARGQVTGVDMRKRESTAFSDLWDAADENAAADGFFLTMTERPANDVFSA